MNLQSNEIRRWRNFAEYVQAKRFEDSDALDKIEGVFERCRSATPLSQVVIIHTPYPVIQIWENLMFMGKTSHLVRVMESLICYQRLKNS